jgi:pilus assembly protein CpaF
VSAVSVAGAVERVRLRLVSEDRPVSTPTVLAALRSEQLVLDDAAVASLVHRLRHELTGLGPLQPLLDDPGVTDVLVNGPDSVWVDRGAGLERSAVCFPDEGAVRRLAQRLVTQTGRPLDDAHPWADAQLTGGLRLHAVLPPVVERACLSIRVSRRRPFTIGELVAVGSLSGPFADVLPALVRSRCSFVVTGGTGSGKTTLLSALLGLVDPKDRVVLVEDTPELAPDHPHVVGLSARPPNAEGRGGVDLRTLVRQALRMRPDRLVVGEVRGGEVADLLAALNTGHEGGCGTVHANRAADLPARVEALAAVAGLSRDAAHSQLAAALHVVVHQTRRHDGARCVGEVAVLERGADGWVQTVPAWTAGPSGVEPGPGRAHLDRLLESGVGAR